MQTDRTDNHEVSFNVTPEDANLIDRIVNRAAEEYQEAHDIPLAPVRRRSIAMDLSAMQAQADPLRPFNLQRLLDAARPDFWHDISGIGHHFDRETGTLTDCFEPRCGRRPTT